MTLEVLPIKTLHPIDGSIFGQLNVALAELSRQDFPVIQGVIVTAPSLKLKTSLEYLDFGQREIFEQSLLIFKKQIKNIPIPENLVQELKGQKKFFLNGDQIDQLPILWRELLNIWLMEIKHKLWREGFNLNLTESLAPQVVCFTKNVKAFGTAYFNPYINDVEIEIESGKLPPDQLKSLEQIVNKANKKLFIPRVYKWLLDEQLCLYGLDYYTPHTDQQLSKQQNTQAEILEVTPRQTVVKSFYNCVGDSQILSDLVDGYYLESENIINQDKLSETIQDLMLKLIQICTVSEDKPVLFKLADIPDGETGIRGTLRLIHQQNLLNVLCDGFLFVREQYIRSFPEGYQQRGFSNLQIVIPYVRSCAEFMQLKRDLAVKKISRSHNIQLWLEISVPENILNLEQYLSAGLAGVILNLDQLLAHLGGFAMEQEELGIYKQQVEIMINFLDSSIKLLQKSKVKFLAYGDTILNPDILEFLVSKGVYGVITKKYEAQSLKDLLYITEKRLFNKINN